MKELTKKQLATLEFISKFIDEHKYSPTVREVASGLGLSSTSSAKFHLKHLEEAGYISNVPGISRAITILQQEQPILIQGAMASEVAVFLGSGQFQEEKIGGYSFYVGQIHSKPVVISQTKIGMANAAASTALGIQRFHPKAILNQGIAGAHREDLETGDIILGKEVVSIQSLEKPTQKEGVDYKKWVHFDFFDGDFPFTGDSELMSFFLNAEYTAGKKIQGVLGSGDVWNREEEYIRYLEGNLKTACEDMETFAVHQIAKEFAVPALGIRIISNNELQGTTYDPSQADVLQGFVMDTLAFF